MNVTLNDLTIVPINETARVVREHLSPANVQQLLGDALIGMARKESAYPALVTLAVSEDCLRVVLLALFADNSLSDSEATFVRPFLNAVAGLFAKYRKDYEPFGSLTPDTTLDLLRKYRNDKEPFGFECAGTSWSGLGICRRVAEMVGDSSALTQHSETLRNLARAVLNLDGVSASEQKLLESLEEHLQAAATGIQNKATPPVQPEAWKIEFVSSVGGDWAEMPGEFDCYSEAELEMKRRRKEFKANFGRSAKWRIVPVDPEERIEQASDQLSTESAPGNSEGRLTKSIAKDFLRDPWSSEFKLTSYTSLDDGAAKALIEHTGPLRLPNLRVLTDSAAAILSRHSNYLDLSGIEQLSDDAIEHLSANKGDLDLSGLTALSRAAAASLSGHIGTLKLDGVKELSDSAAATLAGHQGSVSLMGLKKISPVAARQLANHKWALSLGDIEEFTEPLAAAMSEGNATLLSIQGLGKLSVDVARRLARFTGGLELMCGPQDLPDEVLSALAEHHGWLCFGEGPDAIAPEQACILFAQHVGPLVLNGCSELIDEVAKQAARHNGGLSFPNVCYVSDEVMASLVDSDQQIELMLDYDDLSDSQRKMIAKRCVLMRSAHAKAFVSDPSGGFGDEDVDDLFKLPDFSSPDGEMLSSLNEFRFITLEAAEILAQCGWYLDLSGLTELSLPAAKQLAKHRGSLCLDGLVDPSDDVIAALSEHRGYLSLNGIGELSDRAAQSLANHRGALHLESLATLSESAAASLIAHVGALGITNELLPQEIADILSGHEYVKEELFDDSVVQNDDDKMCDDGDEDDEEWSEDEEVDDDDWSDDEEDE